MNMIFCHGVMGPKYDWDTRTYDDSAWWADWLQFMVEKEHDVIMQKPYFPHAHALLMQYDEWEKIMDFQDINPDTTLIGHSAGGGFVLKYMAQHPELKVKQIILVAPWIDIENEQPNNFYKDLNMENIMSQTKLGVDVLISDDDFPYIKSSVDKIKQNIPDVRIHEFSGRGHFTESKLPEILDIIKF